MAGTWIWYLAEAVSLTVICKIIYNIWFHPLRSYPGPRLAAATRLLYSLKVFQGYHKYFIKSLHDEYGLVVRIAPNELSYIDPRAYEDIYGKVEEIPKEQPAIPNLRSIVVVLGRVAHENGSAGLQKEADFFGPAFNGSDTIADSSSDAVKPQKRNATRAFSNGSLLRRGSVFAACTDLSIEILGGHLLNKQPPMIDLDPWIGNLVLDIHAQLTMSQDLEAIKLGPTAHPLVSRMHATVIALQHSSQLVYLPGIFSFIKALLPRVDLFSAVGNIPPLGPALAARLESEPNIRTSQDFVSHMLQAGGGSKCDLANVRKNCTMFTLSAIEVMPGYICSAIYYLLETPEYYQRARREVRERCRTKDMTPGLTQNMEFLSACMREALRVTAPFQGTLPRRVPTGGATICGQYVPEDTTVGIHNWSITHSGEFWKDPHEFRPERWLNDERYTEDHREAFHPFGVGPRTCVARHLVLLEAQFIVAKLLSAFDIALEPATYGHWPIRKGGHVVQTKGSLWLGMKPRADSV